MTLSAWAGRLVRELAVSVRLLMAHRLRTLLSLSGLLAGVAAVIVMSAVGAGAERRVLDRVRAMGTDLLVVSAAQAAAVAGRERQVATQTLLRPADAEAIVLESPLAVRAAAGVTRPLVVRHDGRNTTVPVHGTTVDGLRIRGLAARAGRLFDDLEDRERRRVALLGPTVARTLFGGADPVGREVRIGAVPFDVVGVLAPRGTDVTGTDLDNFVFIPLETALRRVLNVPYVDALFIQGRSAGALMALEQDTRRILAERHQVRDGAAAPFVIRNQAVLLRTEREATRAMRRLVVGTAALALVLGGIGILAVMLMAVRERVREVGLRRALGARQRDIRLQFLLESALLAAAGGLAGVVVGTLLAGLLAFAGPWDLVLDWRPILLGLVGSTGLGLAVGAIPAARAARLEPIAALRSA